MTRKSEVAFVTPRDESYPALLRNIENPPKKLYYEGELSLLSRPAVAVVGARKATEYGRWAAISIAKRYAECGLVVVSGMAAGIDTFAHTGALEGNGSTVAVLGCGIDICYPRSNLRLRESILQNGLILSEYPPETQPTRFTFPARNRIISGLSLATVIVEAGLSSGSLITAEWAAKQGREVYAVPGNINRQVSIGCNKLIYDGARPLVFIDDVLTDLGIKTEARREDVRGLSEEERIAFDAIRDNGELNVDDLALLTGNSVQKSAALVTILEIKGLVGYYSGKILIAK
ncbi:MAG: DNA-processing protein DprA [Clostridiales Family XIII bacterium]|jgi:DNA processing protein|nr:DNA-processing protein DprA [Clostridiales Family XIII bacterium]